MESLPGRASDAGPDVQNDPGPRDYYEALCEVEEACQEILRVTANPILLPKAKVARCEGLMDRAEVSLDLARTKLQEAGYLEGPYR